MLTLEPGSLCDVCADEFGPHNLPHCIPCGHVLCLNCCNNILEKTSSRKSPACPFCREQFTRGAVRLIRFDFNGSNSNSGTSTPRRSPTSPRPPLIEDDFPNDLLKAYAPVFPDLGEARAREAHSLESKVARVASKKCSVEEVTALQKEVDRWLTEVTAADASTALCLSSLLLKAILANHVAFSDASKAAKNTETSLKLKVDGLEREKGRLEVELHKQKVQHNQKVQECQSLRTELSRFVTTPSVSTASSAASAHTGLSSTSRSSASPPSSRVASPTSSPSYISNIASPLSRLGLSRSASVAPTPPTRSASVAPTSPSRSGSGVPARTSTPGISSYRSATPAAPSFRSSTPVSPSPVRKSRTMSMSQPPPLPPIDRWPAALTASITKPSAPPAAPRPQGPRVPTRA